MPRSFSYLPAQAVEHEPVELMTGFSRLMVELERYLDFMDVARGSWVDKLGRPHAAPLTLYVRPEDRNPDA